MSAAQPQEPWVSIDDVAAHLGVRKDSIYRWIDKRALPAKKIGKLWKLKLSEVDAWVRAEGDVDDLDGGGGDRKVVLVVDDDEPVRESLADFLDDAGYQALQAGDGEEALRLLDSRPRPSLILLDLNMPKLDGWKFREHQLSNPELAKIPVVVITGASSANLEGVTAVLRKPLHLALLATTIETLLEEPARPVA